jgi:hypothetical protein
VAAAVVVALTALGLALGAIHPGLAGSMPPHPTLSGRLGDALDILQNNLRVLAAPYLLWLARFPRRRLTRRVGDAVTLAVTAQSTLPVGVELARWRGQLVPYLPQLPLEWAALTLAISAWLLIRVTTAPRRPIAWLAAVTVVLLAGAAGLETWCTPRRRARPAVSYGMPDRACLVGGGGGRGTGVCAGGVPVAARSQASFPSLRSVPLGRHTGADRDPSTTTDPHKEGSIT